MKSWKFLAVAAALAGGASLAALVAPAAYAQSRSRATIAPTQVFSFTGSGRLGVSVRDVDPADVKGKAASGVVVESVDEGSAAAKAGFTPGDVVVEFDGERVRSVRQFTRLVSETPEGRTVAAAVMRDGQRVTMNVTPESPATRWANTELLRTVPQAMERFERTVPRVITPSSPMDLFVYRGGSQLGVNVMELNDQLAEYFGTKDGVLVSSVTSDSAAAKAGVKAGDVITTVNGSNVTDGTQLRRRLADIDAGGEFTLGIIRDKRAMTLKGKLERPTPPRRTVRTVL